MIGHQKSVNKDFSYSISGNFTYAKNNVVFSDEAPMAEEYQKAEGHPIGSSLRYKVISRYGTPTETVRSTRWIEYVKI